jgi:asparagine synthase (glutamine-hydrolysing)
MCGILGLVDTTGQPLAREERLSRLLFSLAHRGPDDRGELRHGPVWLGHTRLAVLDPSDTAAQPMEYRDGDLALAYNGEIVNYQSLRGQLTRLGHRFRTTSDTEVLLAAYHQWGLDCLSRLAGMFAFALHDRRTGEVVLARDRLGVKPLYYGSADGRVAFCSQPAGVLDCLPALGRRLNPVALSSFLAFRQPLTEDTYFQGVRSLPPGHWLRVREGRCELGQWWRLGQHPAEDLSGPLDALVGSVVRETSVSDVPLAVLLSGGLDSSVIACELSQGTGAELLTVTASVPGAGYNEVEEARATAHALGARHLTVPVSAQDYLAEAAELTRLKGQPLGMHNEVALYLLAKAVKQHATVVMSGEGADELFSGYGRIFRLPFDARRLSVARQLPAPLRRRLLHAAGLSERDMGLDTLDLFLSRYSYWPAEERLPLYSDDMRAAVHEDKAVVAAVERSFAEVADEPLSRQLTHFFTTMHLRGLLDVMDTSFMAAGVEVRVPFTDHRIVGAAMALAERDRLRWRGPLAWARALGEPVARLSERRDITKYALRQAYRHRLPPDVTARRKLPFPVPLSRWLLEDRRAEVDGLLFGPDARLPAVFDRDRLRGWADSLNGNSSDTYGRRLWLLVGAELWLRQNFPDEVTW